MNFDVVTFGSATQDIFVRSKDFKIIDSPEFLTNKALAVEAGSKVYVDDLVFASGGGGTNTAATFALQGLKTAYVGLVGNDSSGRELIRELVELGINCDFIRITDKAKTPVSVILSVPEKERSILVYEGASHLLTREDVPWEEAKNSQWIYMSGLAGESAKVFEIIINFAKENNIKLAVNPGHDQLTKDLVILKSLLGKIDILLVNQEEASIITGIDYKKEKEIFAKFDELVPGIAVMTKGPEGVAVSDGKNIYRAGIPKSSYVERTGSGDAFASGFVSAIIQGKDIENAIQLGTANATSCVQQIGAKNGLLKKDEWGEWGKSWCWDFQDLKGKSDIFVFMNKNYFKKQKGFTLIELLVVIAVIGLLASIILVTLNKSRTRARAARRLSDLSQATAAMELYFDYWGYYYQSTGPTGWASHCSRWGGWPQNAVPNDFQRFTKIIPTDPSMDKTANTSCYIYNSDGIDYKIVDYNISEFTDQDYLSYPPMVDPANDGGLDDCKVDGSHPTAWAIYTPGAACWKVAPP